MITSIVNKFVSKQFIISLLVGGWDTFFGVVVLYETYNTGFYTSFQKLSSLEDKCPNRKCLYLLQAFCFKTRRNILREYLKCWLVYSIGALITILFLMLLVQVVGLKPTVSNLIATLFVAVISFFGHKNISFRCSSPQ